MNEYELIYIIQPELDEDGVKRVDARVAQAIANQNGEITGTEIWGRRKLAYPIKKHFEGYYILHNLKMPPSGVENVERVMRINEDILRFLVMRADK